MESTVLVAIITGSFSFATFLLTRFFTARDNVAQKKIEKESKYNELEEKEEEMEAQIQDLKNVVSRILDMQEVQSNTLDALKECTRSTLRNDIICLYNKYTDKDCGYMPIHERENLDHLTASYYAIDGNGVVPGLVKKLKELPTDKPQG